MGVRVQYVVMYGIVLTGEQADKLFKRDDEEGTLLIPGVIEPGYKITKEHKSLPLVMFEDGMSGKYVVLGRLIDYANEDDGENLRFTKFGGRECGVIEQPLDFASRIQTVDALITAGLPREFVNDKLTYMVFTHYR